MGEKILPTSSKKSICFKGSLMLMVTSSRSKSLAITRIQRIVQKQQQRYLKYTPEANDNGSIKFDYIVSDGNGTELKASNSFELEAVNDAPIVSGPVDLGAIDEDRSIRITTEQLLKNSSDIEGDALSVVDLKLASGQGSLNANQDGSWNFSPTKDWNGSVSLEYKVADRAAKIPDQYLSLSGDYSEYAVIQHSDSLDISGEITISSWVLRDDDGTDWRNVYDIPDAHMLEFSPSGGFDFRAENNNIDFNVNGPEIAHKTWTHVAARMQKLAMEAMTLMSL